MDWEQGAAAVRALERIASALEVIASRSADEGDDSSFGLGILRGAGIVGIPQQGTPSGVLYAASPPNENLTAALDAMSPPPPPTPMSPAMRDALAIIENAK